MIAEFTIYYYKVIVITGSCGNHGYRSNGVYVDGWFGGVCGFGNPFFLMCQNCRDRYMQMNNRNSLPTRPPSRLSERLLVTSSQANKAPDLLDIIDQSHGDYLLKLPK